VASIGFVDRHPPPTAANLRSFVRTTPLWPVAASQRSHAPGGSARPAPESGHGAHLRRGRREAHQQPIKESDRDAVSRASRLQDQARPRAGVSIRTRRPLPRSFRLHRAEITATSERRRLPPPRRGNLGTRATTASRRNQTTARPRRRQTGAIPRARHEGHREQPDDRA